MIRDITFTGIHYDIDEPTLRYSLKKIGKLDKYMSHHAKASVRVEIRLSQVNRNHGNKYEAEVSIHLPGKIIVCQDSTANMLAAIDIVESKLITQLRKYKSSFKTSSKIV